MNGRRSRYKTTREAGAVPGLAPSAHSLKARVMDSLDQGASQTTRVLSA